MTETRVLDGRRLAEKVEQKLAGEIAVAGAKPFLAVVLAGKNEASEIYVRNKQNRCRRIGIGCEIFRLSEDVREAEILELIDELNANPEVNGIIVQLPLPAHLNTAAVLERVCPGKDVDGFQPLNAGRLASGFPGAFVPATPLGIMRLLEEAGAKFCGLHAVVIGASPIVGRPLAALLLNAGCSVSVVHDKTIEIEKITAEADILAVACGCPELVKRTWIKEGAIVIDVGINRENGRLCGDVDFSGLMGKAAVLTPVPGGVGPMTIAMLLENTWRAYKQQHNI